MSSILDPDATLVAPSPSSGAEAGKGVEPDKIGEYRVERLLGQGNMGRVYKCVDPVLNRAVAIKLIAPAIANDPECLKRFEREARSAASIRHANAIHMVATPGRLLDLYQRNAVRFKYLEVLVLDEADRMLDMGFIHDIRKILNLLPKQRQTLMFSATFSREIRDLAKGLVIDPVEIAVNPRNTTVESVKQWICPVDKKQKAALLAKLSSIINGNACWYFPAPSTAPISWSGNWNPTA